jgi:hypothetical protein
MARPRSGFEDIQSGDARWQNLRGVPRVENPHDQNLNPKVSVVFSRRIEDRETKEILARSRQKAAAKKHGRAVQYLNAVEFT